MMVKMSGSEWQFVMCLFRKTYGFNKKEDWITNSQICKAVGLPKERVSEAKKRLLTRNIVTEKRNKISIQKDYEKWIELRKSVTAVTEKRNKVLRKSVNTKEKKETIQNTLGETSSQNNKKGMSWNKQSDEYEEGVVDYDSGKLIDPEEEARKEKSKYRERMNELVDWLIQYQGRDKLRTNRPKQFKSLKELIKMKVTGAEAQQIVMEQMQSDYWKGRKEKPDFSTVVSIIQKRGE